MEKGKKLLITIVCVLTVLALISSSSFAADKPITIKGMVEAAAKDGSGNVIAVQIAAEAETYQVAENAKAKELIPLTGKSVEATGVVAVKADGSKVITIESFKSLEM
jgi:hypothetical protein